MNILKFTAIWLRFDKLRLSIHKTKINRQNLEKRFHDSSFAGLIYFFNSTRNEFEVFFSQKVVKGFLHSIYKIILLCVCVCRRVSGGVIKLLFSISISGFPVNL